MKEELEFAVRALSIGVGATLVMDVWAVFLKRCFGVPSLNYGMVGRWIGHFPGGRFAHSNIAQATAIRGEQVIGWGAHYAIGVIFAAALLAIFGLDWGLQPSFLPALLTGLFTLAAPFFLMQPGMGAGIAASKTPNPNIARLRSAAAHTAFGIGLYLAALATAAAIG